jgi:hypothetical protein
MTGALAAKEFLFATAAPYLGGGGFTPSVTRWATRDGLEGVTEVSRDIPLDVALAGAPSA